MNVALNAALVVLLPLVAGCSAAPSGTVETKDGAAAAPEFQAPSLEGKEFKLSSLKGKVVLMDFWATWCDPCRESVPLFQSLFQKYKGDGFSVVGVSMDAETEGVPAFVSQEKVSYSIVLDPDNTVGRLYRVHGIPNIFLIDKQGRVRKHWVGWDDSLKPEVESEIKTLLQEKT